VSQSIVGIYESLEHVMFLFVSKKEGLELEQELMDQGQELGG
jgi:hypothetical protein